MECIIREIKLFCGKILVHSDEFQVLFMFVIVFFNHPINYPVASQLLQLEARICLKKQYRINVPG